MEWRLLVPLLVEPLRRRQLRRRPTHHALREPVALVVLALLDRAAVELAGRPLLLPVGDPLFLDLLRQRVELVAAGETQTSG